MLPRPIRATGPPKAGPRWSPSPTGSNPHVPSKAHACRLRRQACHLESALLSSAMRRRFFPSPAKPRETCDPQRDVHKDLAGAGKKRRRIALLRSASAGCRGTGARNADAGAKPTKVKGARSHCAPETHSRNGSAQSRPPLVAQPDRVQSTRAFQSTCLSAAPPSMPPGVVAPVLGHPKAQHGCHDSTRQERSSIKLAHGYQGKPRARRAPRHSLRKSRRGRPPRETRHDASRAPPARTPALPQEQPQLLRGRDRDGQGGSISRGVPRQDAEVRAPVMPMRARNLQK